MVKQPVRRSAIDHTVLPANMPVCVHLVSGGTCLCRHTSKCKLLLIDRLPKGAGLVSMTYSAVPD